MIPQNLLDYIKSQLDQNVPSEKIRKDLVDNGWTMDDINQAMSSFNKQSIPEPDNKVNNSIQKAESILPVSNSPIITRSINFLSNTQNTRPLYNEDKKINIINSNNSINTNTSESTNKISSIKPIENTNINTNQKPQINQSQKINLNQQNPTVFIPKQNTSKSKGNLILLITTLVLIALASGFAYAYTTGFNPFSNPPYKQNNIISGVINSLSSVRSGTYKATASLKVVQRESSTIPFIITNYEDKENVEKFKRDYDRYIAITGILPQLKNLVKNGKYPINLNNINSKNSYYKYDINDPITKKPYEYILIKNGTDFNLKVNFETEQAISTIKKYNSNSGFDGSKNTIVVNEDNSVVFNSKSSSYFYLSKTPPPSFFESLNQIITTVPNDMDASVSFGLTSDWGTQTTLAKWKANIDATGNFSDLSYKINGDILKNDDKYYLKVNNIPSLYSFGIEKGQWYSIQTKNNPNSIGKDYTTESLAKFEEQYKKNKNNLIDGLNIIAKIADEKGLYQIKGQIKKEKIGNEQLYKYDLEMISGALVPFYEELANRTKNIKNTESFIFSETLKKIQTKQYQEVLEFIKKNSNTVLWVDSKGYPRVLEYTLKVAPPDDNVRLKNKQVVITLKFELNDINGKVNIDVPSDSKSIDEIYKRSSVSQSVSTTTSIKNIKKK